MGGTTTRDRSVRAALLLMSLVLAAAGCAVVEPSPERTISEVLPAGTAGWNRPLRFTRGPGAEYNADYVAGGDALYYVSDRDGSADIYRQANALSALEAPERLTEHSARDRWPRVDRSGRRVLLVSTRQDSGGDIYLLRHRLLWGWSLSRLTDDTTLDDQPSWHPDGRRFYYAASAGFGQPFDLYVARPGGRPTRLTHGGGQMPDCSPDGRYLVYVASGEGGAPDLRVMRLRDGAQAALTAGPELDLYPCWSLDGARIYFVRFALDTNGDGVLDRRDASSIFSVRFSPDLFDGADAPVPRQLTSFVTSDAFPRAVPGGFTFTRTGGSGGADVYALSECGEMPDLRSVGAFMQFAERVDQEEATNIYGRLLAWQNVIWAAGSGEVRFDLPDRRDVAVAYLRTGRALLDLGRPQAAATAFRALLDRFPGATQHVGSARVELLKLERLSPALDMAAHLERARALEKEFRTLAQQAAEPKGGPLRRTAALARLEAGRALLEQRSYAAALDAFNAILNEYPDQEEAAAQALLNAGRVYAALGGPDSVQTARRTYLRALRQYPGVRPYALRAAELAVDTIVSPEAAFDKRVAGLRDLVENYADEPVLPALAQNYIGDLYYARHDYLKAIEEYERTIRRFPREREQVAAAYLAIGRIRTEQQDYVRAVDAFRRMEEVYGADAGWLHSQARRGYVNSLLLHARHATELGDLALALNTYARLAVFEPALTAAHRGLVESYARLGRVEEAILRYRPRVEADPRDHLAHYALALAYSYYGPDAWVGDRSAMRRRAAIDRQALRLVGQAILVDSDVAYYHQLRGFLLSRLAATTGRDDYKPAALDAYMIALGLGNPRLDPTNWPNLLFNVGEGYMLLDQPANAHQYYRRAVEAGFSLSGRRGRAAMLHISRSAMAAGDYAFAADMLGRVLAGLREAGTDAATLRLRAQALDRLALARNLDGDYAGAVGAYRDYVRELERLSELEPERQRAYARNLLRAYRNMAVNLYLAVRKGQASPAALNESYDLIRRALERLDTVGSVRREESAGPGLVSIDVDVALGESKETTAFDEKAERRLLHTYLARISAAGGNYAAAVHHLESKLSLYPELPEDTARTDLLTEQAVVLTQVGAYRVELGDLAGAAEAYGRAAEMERRAGNLDGEASAVTSLGRVVLRQAREGGPTASALDHVIELHRAVLERVRAAGAARLATDEAALTANLAALLELRPSGEVP